ncbi:hypothetical protein ElyMa_003630000 [Elysia marginata]|uniref:MADF domain-containing protein n=1 Tax=Elysia marginata TaxID=1093978 RepID=A0AAV4ET59_9GAST|nr:hypothetical protein ElyMa_003630000 [Elysia marginata]
MKFSHKVYEKLINLVKERPALYDCQLSEYTDAQLRKNLWENIADELGEHDMNGDDWKKIWRNKRDQFLKKYRDTMNSKSGLVAKAIHRGPFFEQMLFLSDFISPSSKSSSLDQSQELFLEATNNESRLETESLQGSPLHSPATPSISLDETDFPLDESPGLAEAQAQLRRAGMKRRKRGAANDRAVSLRGSISQSTRKSSEGFENFQRMFDKFQEDQSNIYTFLSKKTKELSRESQEWMEDEVMKLYLEARRRDREREAREKMELGTTYQLQMPGTSYNQIVSPTTSTTAHESYTTGADMKA